MEWLGRARTAHRFNVNFVECLIATVTCGSDYKGNACEFSGHGGDGLTAGQHLSSLSQP